MSEDNVTYLPGPAQKPRLATCTHEVPGRVKRLDNLRVPADVVDGDALAKLGLGRGIPHSEGSTRVGFATLKELRRRALAAEYHANLSRIEYEKLVRHLSDLIGDDDGDAA